MLGETAPSEASNERWKVALRPAGRRNGHVEHQPYGALVKASSGDTRPAGVVGVVGVSTSSVHVNVLGRLAGLAGICGKQVSFRKLPKRN